MRANTPHGTHERATEPSPGGHHTAERWSSTTSPDGTRVAYASLGSGPGLVMVHGSMQSALSHRELARMVGGDHTVHLVDRRGRGRSGDGASGTDAEVDDLLAVLGATGSRAVFGVSSGALIALRAGLRSGSIDRLAVFEPALIVAGSLSLDWLDRFHREYAAGDLPSYLVTAMLAAEMGPPVFNRIPRRVLRFLTSSMLRATERKRDPDGPPTMTELAPALRHDFRIIEEQAERLGDFEALTMPVLVLSGTKSRPYLRTASRAVSRTVRSGLLVELPGLDHGATGNAADRGRPAAVAPALLEFLAG